MYFCFCLAFCHFALLCFAISSAVYISMFIIVSKQMKSILSDGLYFALKRAESSCTFALDVNKP